VELTYRRRAFADHQPAAPMSEVERCGLLWWLMPVRSPNLLRCSYWALGCSDCGDPAAGETYKHKKYLDGIFERDVI